MTNAWIGIARMAAQSGLSIDTLRWYEKTGLLPSAERGPDGRRRYGERDQALVMLLVRLRETGMPTADMRRFVALLGEGAASHGRRIGLLEETRAMLDERRSRIDAAREAVDAKIAHYEHLIAHGLDCDGGAVPRQLRARQAERTLPRADDRLRPPHHSKETA